jgi:DNA-damage-inducible protein D
VPGEDIEFWFARDLQELLGYDSWITFSIAMRRAINACGSGYEPVDHFRSVMREAVLGGDVECDVEDFMLTRYGCYLIACNSDPRRMTIVFARSYFAIQTRRQKLVDDRMRLQAMIDARACLPESGAHSPDKYERGEDDEGFARIRMRDDPALLGGRQGQREIQLDSPPVEDIRKLARRLKGELRALVRDFLT